MRRLLATLAALAALAATTAPANAATPRDARAFVDTIGVNTHLFYDDTAYGNFAMTKQRLQELGVRHVRDSFDPDRRQFFFDRVNNLGQAGIKSTLIACRMTGNNAWQTDAFVSDAKNKVRSSLDAIEGVNEPNFSGYSDWVNTAQGCQYYLNRYAKDGTMGAPLTQPVLGPSATFGGVQELGYIGDRADAGNFHPYPGGQAPSGPGYHPLSARLADVRTFGFNGQQVPVYATETGYHDAVNSPSDHPSVSQKAAAIYLPRLFLENDKAGVARTFTYELVDQFSDPQRDDLESNFGLFESDWSYKPAATALKNTIGLLDSPSASAKQPLGYTLSNTADPDGSGTGGAVKDRLMQKADGSWWLALWQDSTVYTKGSGDIANPTVRVGVKLDRTLTATGYRPTLGAGTYGSVTASSFTAGVSDDVLLIRLR
jgi:hypothetical protein